MIELKGDDVVVSSGSDLMSLLTRSSSNSKRPVRMSRQEIQDVANDIESFLRGGRHRKPNITDPTLLLADVALRGGMDGVSELGRVLDLTPGQQHRLLTRARKAGKDTQFARDEVSLAVVLQKSFEDRRKTASHGLSLPKLVYRIFR